MHDQTVNGIANGIKVSVVELPSSVSSTHNNETDFKRASTTKKKAIHNTTDNSKSLTESDKNLKGNIGCMKDSMKDYATMFAAELLGTGLLMFLGCMGCVTNEKNEDNPPFVSGLTFGLTIMLIIQCFGHISGAHLNPAVTIATVLLKMISPAMAVVYIVAQFVGATLGFGLLKILLSRHVEAGFCITAPSESVSILQALCLEIVITVVLILVCCSVWDKRNADKPDSIPLRFGLIIVAISLAAGPHTGASMNTARSFAPLVYGGEWSGQWIYFVGPNIAAVLGCGIYKVLFALPEDEEKGSKEEHIYLDEVTQKS